MNMTRMRASARVFGQSALLLAAVCAYPISAYAENGQDAGETAQAPGAPAPESAAASEAGELGNALESGGPPETAESPDIDEAPEASAGAGEAITAPDTESAPGPGGWLEPGGVKKLVDSPGRGDAAAAQNAPEPGSEPGESAELVGETPETSEAAADDSIPAPVNTPALDDAPVISETAQVDSIPELDNAPGLGGQKRGGAFIELSLGAVAVAEEGRTPALRSTGHSRAGGEDCDDNGFARKCGGSFGLHGGYMFNHLVGVRAGVRSFAGAYTSYDIGAALVFGRKHSFYLNPGLSFLDIGGSGLHFELGYGFVHDSGFNLKVGLNYFADFDASRRERPRSEDADDDDRHPERLHGRYRDAEDPRSTSRRGRGDDGYYGFDDDDFDDGDRYIDGNYAGGFGLSFGYRF